MVLQTPRPFAEMTVRENVVLGAMFGSTDGRLDEATAYERAEEALGFVRLAERGDDDVGTLNLHEQRFLELARALAGRPQLLLLDEVMAGLERHRTAGVDRDRAHGAQRARRHGDLGRARDEGGAQPRRAHRRVELRPAAGGRRAARRDARARRWSRRTSASESGAAAPMLDVAELSAGYLGEDVVHGASLTAAEGEVVAVIGSNGAGKTTLVPGDLRFARAVAWRRALRRRHDHRSTGAPHRQARASPTCRPSATCSRR